MASVIEAEAIGEPDTCKCLVGEVLENRAKANGQTLFEASHNGFARKKPSAKAKEIARKVLSSQHEHAYHYFLNPQTATDKKQLRRARRGVMCGRHKFF